MISKKKHALYEKYLIELKQNLIKKYYELGLKAAGKYEQELQHEIKNNKLKITGAYHSWFMEHGRKPSQKFPPRKDIEDWIQVKQGLPSIFKEKKKQFAFLIARKIAKEGIKVPNQYNAGQVISEVVNEFLGNTVYEMLKDFSFVYVHKIQSDILKTINTIK